MVSDQLIELSKCFKQIASQELRSRFDPKGSTPDGNNLDLLVEAMLVDAAKQIYPDVIPTGEENISYDLSSFFDMAQKNKIWIFDPLDGSTCFHEGRETYGVMGAYVDHGSIDAAILYTPEQDILILAERDKGCWLVKEGEEKEFVQIKIGPRPDKIENKARVAFACRNQDANSEQILANGVETYMPRYNACHDYTRLLTGKIDATFYSEGQTEQGIGKCPPWDHAAGVLAVQEAGGYSGLPYDPNGIEYNPLQCHDRMLVAASKELFQDVYAHIEQRAPKLLMPY